MTQPTESVPTTEQAPQIQPAPALRRAALEARYPRWRPRAIHEWLLAVVAEFPEREFIVTDEHAFSYREIAARVGRMAAGLAARGVRRGDHVAVLLGNRPEYVVAKYALSRLGAVMVPLNVRFRRDELAFVLRHSRASALLTVTGLGGLDHLDLLDQIAPGWAAGGRLAALPDLRLVVQLPAETPARPGVVRLAEVEATPGVAELGPGPGPDDISLIFYTSGTTGAPKGVLWTHDQDARLGLGGALTRAFGDGWRVQSALPLFHSFANNEVLNATMFAAGAVILRPSFAPVDFLGAIERHRPDELVTVPTMVVALCEAAAARHRQGPPVTGLMCAGAMAPVWLWERAVRLLGAREGTTGYGMTETGGGPVMSRPEDGIAFVASTVGRPKYGGPAGVPELGGHLAEVRTVDPRTGAPLPEGEEGELVSRGPTNAVGYWELPAETARTFRDGWVHTGDLGRVRPDGAIVLTGRTKELIRSGGENVAPKEVEDVLTAHPAISQAFVVGVPDERWGEVGCAWLVLESGASLTADEVLALCRERLAGFKRPRAVRFIAAEDLPTTPTGKVQKFRLSEMAAGRDAEARPASNGS
ncbi:MAG: class I adenylate-forming enzyme family protein [Nocardioides sp.]|uniref:class I adenylate-forming enzyme family protein n=1 Tax=Nocardioides sp. TaxID=35761 RepID=UPI0039E36959